MRNGSYLLAMAQSLRSSSIPLHLRPVRKLDKIVIKPSSKTPAALSPVKKDLPASFKHFKLRKDVLEALEDLKITQPTVIQMLATPHILRGKNVLCASETGSGKTLAYLVPLMHRLKHDEEVHGLITRIRKPRALIIVPTRDLAHQVLATAKCFSHVVKARVVGIFGGKKRKFVKDTLTKPVDVVVATPHSLLKIRNEEKISFLDLSHLVIDEADTLFDESFDEPISTLFKLIKIRESKPKNPTDLGQNAQVTVVSATIPNKMLEDLAKFIPNLKKISTKHVHKVLPNVEQQFIKVLADKKADKLLEIINSQPHAHTIVFCNTVPSCDWTGRFLESNNVPVVRLHAGFDKMDREDKLKEFASGKCKVLVSTDIASRGIDCSRVTRIIQFDWPNNLTDYMHRLGRTGRVGTIHQKSCVYSLMTRRRDIRMAWQIKDSADKKETILNKKSSIALDVTRRKRKT